MQSTRLVLKELCYYYFNLQFKKLGIGKLGLGKLGEGDTRSILADVSREMGDYLASSLLFY